MQIRELNYRDDIVLITDSQNVRELREFLTFEENLISKDLDGFFVVVKDGEYREVYGFSGIVPYLQKPVYRIR